MSINRNRKLTKCRTCHRRAVTKCGQCEKCLAAAQEEARQDQQQAVARG